MAKTWAFTVTKEQRVIADALAQLADLKPEDAENFRRAVYPAFVPEPWWDFDGIRIADWKMWQEMQNHLRETWDAGFPADYVLTFLIIHSSTVTDPDTDSIVEVYRSMPYQQAAMFLFNESWRARVCNQCRKRFVAVKPNDQYCSQRCKTDFRRHYKADYIREKRRQNKRKPTKRGGR